MFAFDCNLQDSIDVPVIQQRGSNFSIESSVEVGPKMNVTDGNFMLCVRMDLTLNL